jgi:phage-related protein
MAKQPKSPEQLRDEAIETARIVDDAMRSISSRIGELFGEARDEVADISKELVKEVERGLKGLASNAEAIADARQKALSGSYKQRDVAKEMLKKQKAIFVLEVKIKEAAAAGAANHKELTKELEKAKGYASEFEKTLQKSADQSTKITKAMGLTGVSLKGLKKVAGSLGIDGIEDIFSDAAAASEKMARTVTDSGQKAAGLGGKMRVAFAGAATAAKGIGKALMDPLFIIGMIIKAGKALIGIYNHVKKLTNDVGQAFGIAGKNAEYLKKQIHELGDGGALDGIYINTEEILKNQKAINDTVGVNLRLNKENVKTYQNLSEYAGYSAEQIAALYKISLTTGSSFQTIHDDVVGTTESLNKATGFSASQSQIFDQLAGASGSVKFNIKGGTEGLVKAAHTAARLGLTMDEIAAAAASHLDFESSIAKEIEAEMFLQKDLNLDKLRYAAMTGDTAMAAAEEARLIRENAGALRGNVIAQQAFADATGIGMDRLGTVLDRQDQLAGLSGEQLETELAKEESLVEQGKQAQEFARQMQDVVRQIKKAFEPLAMEIVPKILTMVQKLTPMIINAVKLVAKVAKFFTSPLGKKILGIAAIAYGVTKVVKATGLDNFLGRGANSMMPMYTKEVGLGGGGGGGGGYGGGGGGGGGGGSRGNKNIKTGTDKRGRKFHYDKKTGRRVKAPTSNNRSGSNRRGGRRRRGRGIGGALLGMGAYLGADYLMSNIGSSGDESAGGYNGAEGAGGTEGYNPENHTVAGYDGGANTTNAMVGGGMAGISGMDMGMMGAEVGVDALTGNMGNKAKTTPKPKTSKPKPKKVKSKGFFGGIKDYASKAVSNVKGVASSAYNSTKGAASSAYNSTKGAASSAYNSTKGAVSTAYQGAKTFAQPALDYTGKAVNKVKNVAMNAADITKQAKEWIGKKITGITPNLLKGIKKPLRGVLSKIPLVGAILEGIFTKMDVDSIVADGGYENKQDMFSEMGNSVISGGLGLTMGSLAAGAVSSLQAVGIPGWLLAGAAYMGGDFLGRLIGDAISDHVGGPLLGKAIFDTFYGGGGGADAMQVPESGEITELATGGIVTGPTNAIVGEAGPEAVIPLREFYAKFDQLIAAVNKGGNVYLDGNKVGYSLALQSSQM